MNNQKRVIFGIDLGTTYSCISYVDEYGKAIVIPNREHHLTTPSVVLFEGNNRIVGDEAKNSALLNPENVVEMVKRHMGEADWRFPYEGKEYSAEEISSYILRKLASDTEEVLNIPVKEVVITCPAYFGITQREATARAGMIAGLTVHEVINEPTAAAITYGLQNVQDQTVLVYDLGGGTFDITIIEIKNNATTVIATGGDHHLGGRDWDEAIVIYLAEQWQRETGSSEDPLETPETLQDLWLKAEKAKQALTPRNETKVVVSHAGQHVRVTLTRTKFDELTAGLLDRTVLFTRMTTEAARARGYQHFDQILLVGGSTRMPQVAERIEKEFNLPLRIFEPEEAVAKGAAMYAQRLLLNQNIHTRASEIQSKSSGQKHSERIPANHDEQIPAKILEEARSEITSAFGPEQKAMHRLATASITNVASHSFGIIVTIDFGTPTSREVISNLVRVNDPLPAAQTRIYGTIEENQENVDLKIMENTEETTVVEQEKYTGEAEIGTAILLLPPGLQEDSPIEVVFELNEQGRLHVTGRDVQSGRTVEASFETRGGITSTELQEAKTRSSQLHIS